MIKYIPKRKFGFEIVDARIFATHGKRSGVPLSLISVFCIGYETMKVNFVEKEGVILDRNLI